MKQILFLFLFLLSFSAFAETQQSITNTLDEAENCRSVSSINASACANHVVYENLSLSAIAPLIDEKSAAVASFLINKIYKSDMEITIESRANAESLLTNLFNVIWRAASIVAAIFFTWSFVTQIGLAMTNKGGIDSSTIGWTIFNQSFAFLLICGKAIIAGFIGCLVAGVFIATMSARNGAIILSHSASFDEAAYYQRAERYAKLSSEAMFNKLVTINVGIDSVQSEMLAKDLRRTDVIRIFMRDSQFEKCLKDDYKYSDSFFNGNMKDSKTLKTQACLLINGYQSYEPGQLAYIGGDESIQSALIEMNKASRKYAYEFRKMACGEALAVEDKRYQLAPDLKAYTTCLNRSEDGQVIRTDDKDSVNFLPESDLDLVALSKIKTDAIDEFAKVFGQWSISQRTIAEVDTDLTTESNLFVVLYRITQQQSGYPKWKAYIEDEFAKIAVNVDGSFSASGNGLGKLENKAEQLAESLSGNIKEESQLIDINQSLRVALKDTMRLDNGQVMNQMLTAANFLGGNVFENAGFTGQNCFAPDNSCIAPFANQIATAAASNIQYAQNLFKTNIVTKVSVSLLTTFAPDASYGRIMGMVAYIAGFLLAFAVLNAVASVVPVFVYMGLITTYAIRTLWMIIISFIDVIMLLPPTKNNLKQTGLNSKLWNIVVRMVWILIVPSVCIGVFFINIGLYGSSVVAMGYIVYTIATHFVGSDGSLLIMVLQFIVMCSVYQLLNLVLMAKITMYCVNIIKFLDKTLTGNANVQNTADTITHAVNNSVSKVMAKIK